MSAQPPYIYSDLVAGQDVTPLVLPVEPIRGESLIGLVQRAASLNCVGRTGDILEMVGALRQHPGSVTGSVAGSEGVLAKLLGVRGGADALGPMMNRRNEGRPGWQDFFGATIRMKHVERKTRRVSPRALQRSLHLRAMWSIRPITFDPQTMELLIGICPECRRALTFSGTKGLQYCDHCTRVDERNFVHGLVDLRDFPQPRVSVEDREALDFAIGLLDPDPVRRMKAERLGRFLHADLQALDRGQLFEICVALARVVESVEPRRQRRARTAIASGDARAVSPSGLADGARVLLSWPDGLHELANRCRNSAHLRAGHYGSHKEIGPLLELLQSPSLARTAREIFRRALDQTLLESADDPNLVRKADNRPGSDLVTCADAASILGKRRSDTLRMAQASGFDIRRASDARRSPILLSRRDILSVRDELEATVSQSQVSAILGLAGPSVMRICEAGLITRAKEFERRWSAGRPHYLRSSVDALATRLRSACLPGRPPEASLSLKVAMKDSPPLVSNPWADVFQSIIARRLPAWAVGDTGLPLVDALVVSNAGDLRGASEPGPLSPTDSGLTSEEAGSILGKDSTFVKDLQRRALLPDVLTPEAIDEFRAKYAFTSEVYELARSRGSDVSLASFTGFMRIRGLKPVAAVTSRRRRVWDRAAAESSI